MKSLRRIVRTTLDDMAGEPLWLRVLVCFMGTVILMLPGIVILLIWCFGIDELEERLRRN